jgi:hypothetical protein
MSISSRLWLAAHEICPPISIQMIFEGSGVLELDRWQKAVEIASHANPGSRFIVRGHLGASRWVDSGKTPPVRMVDGSHWNGMSSVGAEFLYGDYSPRNGPMAEVVLARGNPLRVAFRAHHALMDGRGCLTWAENIFRALRGEPVIASDDTVVEDDLLHIARSRPARPLGNHFIAPTGFALGFEPGILWHRKRVAGRFPKLLPRILVLTAREVWRHGTGNVRIAVPVDLRSRRPGLRSTGNLTNAIFLDITPDDTADSLAYELLRRLREQQDGMLTWEEKLLPRAPLWFIKAMLRKEARQGHMNGVYRHSALVSNLGQISLDAFQGGGFISHAYIAVPLCLESFPFSIAMNGSGNEIDILLSMPKVLANGGRMEETLDRIEKGLESSREDIPRARGAM